MGNIITSGGATIYAGANVLAGIPENNWTTWISGAEAVVNSMVRNNWSDSFAAANEDASYILAETVGRMVANDAIKHDMNAYTSRIEAEDMVNINRDAINRNLSVLRNKQTETFIDAA